MATQTKKRKTPATEPTNAEAETGQVNDLRGYEANIELHQIVPSSLNPRQTFDQAELEQLAESLKTHGQLQNIVVRRIEGQTYDLIGGERRWRAAGLAGLSTIRAKVITCSDEIAIELRGIENYRRQQLNAVEEAIWFQQMIGTGRFNQTTLAAYLGITAGQVSNRLRLLRLPQAWQDKIVNGDLSPTHARELVQWAERPAVLERLAEKLVFKDLAEYSVGQFAQLICDSARGLSRSMVTDGPNGRRFETNDELNQQLDIVEFSAFWGVPATPRAFNVELWDRLQAEAIEAAKAKAIAEANAESDDSDDEEEDQQYSAKPSESAGEKSGLSEGLIRRHWTKHIASSLASHLKPDAYCLRLMWSLLVHGGEEFLDFAINGFGADHHIHDWETRTSNDDFDQCVWKAVGCITEKDLKKIAYEFVMDDLTSEGLPFLGGPLFLLSLCLDFKADPRKTWMPDAELLKACSTSQLRELVTDEMGFKPSQVNRWEHAALVKNLAAAWPAGYCPVLLTPEELQG